MIEAATTKRRFRRTRSPGPAGTLASSSASEILRKTTFPEVPLRAEYSLTPFGANFVDLVKQLEADLQRAR